MLDSPSLNRIQTNTLIPQQAPHIRLQSLTASAASNPRSSTLLYSAMRNIVTVSTLDQSHTFLSPSLILNSSTANVNPDHQTSSEQHPSLAPSHRPALIICPAMSRSDSTFFGVRNPERSSQREEREGSWLAGRYARSSLAI